MYIGFFKRIMDLIISLLTLFILLPLFIPIVIALLLSGEHHVFYLQDRVGYKNINFKIWKFATMLLNSPNIGTGSLTVKDDPRILPLGKFLRKTKINELPQIINVIIGNMSIVGPRPQMEVDFLKFPEIVQKEIYKSKPGVTGIGSIVFRDEERWISNCTGDKHIFYKNYIAPYKGTLELWYKDNSSLLTDIKIIFLTAWVILFPKTDLVFKIFKDAPPKPKHLN